MKSTMKKIFAGALAALMLAACPVAGSAHHHNRPDLCAGLRAAYRPSAWTWACLDRGQGSCLSGGDQDGICDNYPAHDSGSACYPVGNASGQDSNGNGGSRHHGGHHR